MHFIVEDGFLSLFPAVAIGVLVGRGVVPKEDVTGKIQSLRKAAEDRLFSLNLRTEQLTTHPNIGAWRAAYQAFGVKAKRHQPTHEALVRRLLKEEGWPTINSLVDVYLTNQAYHMLPHGGYDLDALNGTLRLTVAGEGEPFIALGGEAEETSGGEVIYRDDSRILTRRWNYKDNDVTKLTPETRNFVLMIEAPLGDIALASVQEATDDLLNRYTSAFDGDFTASVLQVSPSSREFNI